MNQITNNLIKETKELVFSLKLNYMAIAENLYKIREAWTGSVDEWVDFYQNELELHKSTVSKMLTVGPASIANGWRQEGVSLEKLYRSLVRNRENPQLALAEAKTWGDDDYEKQAKEDCPGADLDMETASAKCRNCKKWHLIPKK